MRDLMTPAQRADKQAEWRERTSRPATEHVHEFTTRLVCECGRTAQELFEAAFALKSARAQEEWHAAFACTRPVPLIGGPPCGRPAVWSARVHISGQPVELLMCVDHLAERAGKAKVAGVDGRPVDRTADTQPG
jgi:hypothetical protein